MLLDTHAFIWAGLDRAKLPKQASRVLNDIENRFFISPVSIYEITFKWNLGKWPEVSVVADNLPEYVSILGFELSVITVQIMAVAGFLSVEHRDPFDRMIAAQAIIDAMPIMSADAAFDLFDVERIWD